MKVRKYTVGEINRLIAESSTKNEFKPIIGNGVESKNKSENDKAYKEAKKRGKAFDGGLKDEKKSEPKVEKSDGNKTMLSINAENASDEWKERVKIQAQGYTSKLEKDNKIEKDPSAEFNTREYDAFAKEAGQMEDNIETEKKAGLRGHNMPNGYFKRPRIYKEAKYVDFKHTKFLSEEHMISRIPDELKNEGQVFHMRDNAGNDYLCEWSNNKAEVISHENPKQLNETLDRMRDMMKYNPNEQRKTNRKQF